ncbi:MAG: hypothetical protein LBD58_08255 [Treponema sp.]|nr:hypothetical protein [Treponema sp.]
MRGEEARLHEYERSVGIGKPVIFSLLFEALYAALQGVGGEEAAVGAGASPARQSGREPPARAGVSLAPERARSSRQSGCQPPARAGAILAPERV